MPNQNAEPALSGPPCAPWATDGKLPPNNLDFVRLVLACTVIFGHSWMLAGIGPGIDFCGTITHHQVDTGQVAVNAFFIVSGFLITMSWQRSKSTADFLLKRVLRIYPGFIAAMIIAALVVVPLSTGALPSGNLRDIAAFIYRTLILVPHTPPNAFPHNPFPGVVVGSAWTISYEFDCYFFVAALGLLGILNRNKFLVALAVLIGAIAAVGVYHPYLLSHANENYENFLRSIGHQVYKQFLRISGSPSNWPRFLTYYLAGVLFFLYRSSLPHSALWASISALALLLSALFATALAFTLPTCGTYLLLWFAFHPRIKLHHAARFGDLSYGAYLYAFPIQQLIVQHFAPRMNPWLLFCLSVPLALLAGFISWHAIEKWFLRLKPRSSAVPSAASHSISPRPLSLTEMRKHAPSELAYAVCPELITLPMKEI